MNSEETMKRMQFHPWTSLRDALEEAYKKLGLEMEQLSPNSRGYSTEHWNLAGLVRKYVIEHDCSVSCLQCKTSLTVHTVIRCLDCRAPLCESCAPAHFGPQHVFRAAAAHPSR